jgi:hypothetical protein
MKNILGCCLLLAFLSVGYQAGPRDVEQVELFLSDGVKMEAEIVALRDTSIVVLADSASSTQMVLVLPHNRIMSVRLPGNSHILAGALMGCGAGCATGALIGCNSKTRSGCKEEEPLEQQANGLSGGIIGSLAGALIGGAVGGVASTGERVLVSPVQRDFNVLRPLARYPDEEPEYLQRVAPR